MIDHQEGCSYPWGMCRCLAAYKREVERLHVEKKDMIQRNHILCKRPDLPIDRLKLHDTWTAEQEKLRAEVERLRKALQTHDKLFKQLDEAMASPQRIAADIIAVGCFVSSLNLIDTEDEIVARAINNLKHYTEEELVFKLDKSDDEELTCFFCSCDKIEGKERND